LKLPDGLWKKVPAHFPFTGVEPFAAFLFFAEPNGKAKTTIYTPGSPETLQENTYNRSVRKIGNQWLLRSNR
jgi:hypothetical protein